LNSYPGLEVHAKPHFTRHVVSLARAASLTSGALSTPSPSYRSPHPEPRNRLEEQTAPGSSWAASTLHCHGRCRLRCRSGWRKWLGSRSPSRRRAPQTGLSRPQGPTRRQEPRRQASFSLQPLPQHSTTSIWQGLEEVDRNENALHGETCNVKSSTEEAAHEGWQRLRNSYKGRFVILQA